MRRILSRSFWEVLIGFVRMKQTDLTLWKDAQEVAAHRLQQICLHMHGLCLRDFVGRDDFLTNPLGFVCFLC